MAKLKNTKICCCGIRIKISPIDAARWDLYIAKQPIYNEMVDVERRISLLDKELSSMVIGRNNTGIHAFRAKAKEGMILLSQSYKIAAKACDIFFDWLEENKVSYENVDTEGVF